MRASETTEMIFDNCRVPVANLLGNVGEGFKQAMKVLDGGRISIAALSLGIAKGAYEAALAYAQERHQFGQPISSFQAISFKLADMATEIEAAELLIRQSADLKNRGQKMTKESAMAKYFASEVAVRAATEAVQIFGGYGYTKDFPVEKFYRDSKLCTIGEGTSEIQKIVIFMLSSFFYAFGWACLYIDFNLSIELCVYTWVAAKLACPSNSLIAFKSAPLFNRLVAYECRNTWGLFLSCVDIYVK